MSLRACMDTETRGKILWFCKDRTPVFQSVIKHLTEQPRFDPRERIFPLASVSRPALRPTQPPIQCVPEVLSPGVKRGRGMNLVPG
jgi:hypothetical protein